MQAYIAVTSLKKNKESINNSLQLASCISVPRTCEHMISFSKIDFVSQIELRIIETVLMKSHISCKREREGSKSDKGRILVSRGKEHRKPQAWKMKERAEPRNREA